MGKNQMPKKRSKKFDAITELKRLAREELGTAPPSYPMDKQRKHSKHRQRDLDEPEYWIKGDGQKELEQ